jgi:hypothetical protein
MGIPSWCAKERLSELFSSLYLAAHQSCAPPFPHATHPSAQQSVARGQCYVLPLWEGPACPLEAPPLSDSTIPAVYVADFLCDQRCGHLHMLCRPTCHGGNASVTDPSSVPLSVVMITGGGPGEPCRLVAEVLPDEIYRARMEVWWMSLLPKTSGGSRP